MSVTGWLPDSKKPHLRPDRNWGCDSQSKKTMPLGVLIKKLMINPKLPFGLRVLSGGAGGGGGGGGGGGAGGGGGSSP